MSERTLFDQAASTGVDDRFVRVVVTGDTALITADQVLAIQRNARIELRLRQLGPEEFAFRQKEWLTREHNGTIYVERNPAYEPWEEKP